MSLALPALRGAPPDPAALVAALEASLQERCRHLLTLADRTPYAPSYGCFDRSWWQYKIKDFPSGMSQECLYPLALALEQRLFPQLSAAAGQELRRLIQAGAAFSLQGQHGNGSVDDYFPYEQAAGATAFSLFAILEAQRLGALELPSELLPRLARRLYWLAQHRESGRLSNHEALISLCLARGAALLGDPALAAVARQRFERLMSWRSEEGWFEEYGGFDVGYESLTFACLRELAEALPECRPRVQDLLDGHARLILAAVEPDGCLGGELFARATWNWFGHGLLAHAIERADRGDGDAELELLLRVLEARWIRYPTAVRDDFVIQHHLWSDLRCLPLLRGLVAAGWGASQPGGAADLPPSQIERQLPQAGHLWLRHGDCCTHVSLRLGGAFRLYRQERFVVQDTQLALRVEPRPRGLLRWRRPAAATYLATAQAPELRWCWEDAATLRIEGPLSAYRPQPMTPLKLIVLRLLMLSLGRYWADGIRALMQRLLIAARPDPQRSFVRRLRFRDDGLVVEDRVRLPAAEAAQASLIPTTFSSFRHVVMSRVFHPYALELQEPLRSALGQDGPGLSLERRW
ncbi:hypothetical protein KBZ20_09010 [Vulcanococcus limneticus Candia 3F8]|uniref:hypothetical protein n=1 Tax=Vulcanococcus limneticus TaxID=2170428 RepID=UPI0012FF6F2D|nr:hypothetical protein [Vulcanococcus limneticus]MCP9792104.1 hypothetical protein [Vulcanococcus limneticus MW73D5]MCP9893911.1 hypothetical protein [Vulcanococcus limneticus Candia 3F8]MCP9897482.1 hypothetical protein [Vulcanococcus limneticus Candia 3B3]